MAKMAPNQDLSPVELCIPPYTLCGVAASASSEWININRLQNTSLSPLGTHHSYIVYSNFFPVISVFKAIPKAEISLVPVCYFVLFWVAKIYFQRVLPPATHVNSTIQQLKLNLKISEQSGFRIFFQKGLVSGVIKCP